MMTKADELRHEEVKQDLRYLKLLSKKFPTIAEACTEIINLEAILELPKGTEHFLTDIHGEYEAFQHVLKNASGSVARKVNEIFGQTMLENDKKELCTLIYYPEEKLELVNKGWKKKDIAERLGLSYGGLHSMMTETPVHVYTLEMLLEMTGKELVVRK